MDSGTKEKLSAAKADYERAGQELAKVTAECYPVGQTVAVDLGRSRVVGKVTNAGGCWWHSPDTVTITNIATEKTRHFGGASLDIYHPQFLQT